MLIPAWDMYYLSVIYSLATAGVGLLIVAVPKLTAATSPK